MIMAFQLFIINNPLP